MTDALRISGGWRAWEVRDRMRSVQGAPVTKDPATGKHIDPTGITLHFRWYTESGWVLIAAEVDGVEVAEDGTYPHEEEIVCDFYDPLGGEPGEGRAPEWLVSLADRRAKMLPHSAVFDMRAP